VPPRFQSPGFIACPGLMACPSRGSLAGRNAAYPVLRPRTQPGSHHPLPLILYPSPKAKYTNPPVPRRQLTTNNQQPATRSSVLPCKAKHDSLEAHPRVRRNALPWKADPARLAHHSGHTRRRHPSHRGRERLASRLRPNRRRRPCPRPGRVLLPRRSHSARPPAIRPQPLTSAQYPHPLRRAGRIRLPRPPQRAPQDLRVPHLPAPPRPE